MSRILKPGMSLDDFNTQVIEDSQGKHDYNVLSNQVKMDIHGKLVTKPLVESDGFKLNFTELGFRQMCQKLNAPELSDYGLKLYELGQTARLSQLFNYHLEEINKAGERDLWLRSKNEKCRAVFSGKYGVYDNDFLSDVILDAFKDKNVDVVTNSISDNYMNCRIRLLDSQFNASDDDPLFTAIHVQNSEVGLSSVNVFLVVYRQVCTNGMVRQVSKNTIFRHKHIGDGYQNRQAVAEKLNLAFEYTQQQGNEILEEFAQTQSELVEMPMEAIEVLSKGEGYSQKFTERVVQNYLVEKNPTRYGIINAFTGAARELQDERRLEVERFAGTLLTRKIPA